MGSDCQFGAPMPNKDSRCTYLYLHGYTWEVYHTQGGGGIARRIDRIWDRRDVPWKEPIAPAASMKDT